jgi:hypothetical protein
MVKKLEGGRPASETAALSLQDKEASLIQCFVHMKVHKGERAKERAGKGVRLIWPS